jgi:hypothetical protein
LGEKHRYQGSAVIALFRNDAQRNEEIRNPRTITRLSSQQRAAQPAKTKKGQGAPKVQRDWIHEPMTKEGEEYINNAHRFWSSLDTNDIVHVVTDGWADPNPGPAGWGAILRQNKWSTMLWQHFLHAPNNAMDLRAAAGALM